MHNNQIRKQQGDAYRHEHTSIPRRFVFSANEIGFAGYSGAGKTTLITAVIEAIGADYRVAFVKHDVHGFSMDHEGKDTWRAARSGASQVLISNPERYALLGSGHLDEWSSRVVLNEADIVLVEGYKHSPVSKIAVVDPKGEILDDIRRGEIGGVLAYAVRDDMDRSVERRLRETAKGTPVLSASDTGSVVEFVLGYLDTQARHVPLYGLVLGGGKSTRMQRDKAKIEYRRVPQVRYAYELLAAACDRAFVSIRADQSDDPVFAGLEQIHDRFTGIGPMGGMLSAMHEHPEAAWLVLGCDLPFVDTATLEHLLANRDPLLQATCYESAHDGLPEPLCTVYERATGSASISFSPTVAPAHAKRS